jgi:hypothetical protein
MNEKPWYMSRTIWLNVLTLIVVVLTAMLAQDGLVSPEIAKWLLVAIASINGIVSLFLRADTTAALTRRRQ